MNDDAVALDMPNNQNPCPRAPIKYGNQHVPMPTNSEEKVTHSEEVMRAVLEGK